MCDEGRNKKSNQNACEDKGCKGCGGPKIKEKPKDPCAKEEPKKRFSCNDESEKPKKKDPCGKEETKKRNSCDEEPEKERRCNCGSK